MAASRNKVSSIVSGAGLLTSIFTKLDQAVRARGGSDEHIHRLSTPEGDAIFAEWASILVGRRVDSYPLTINFDRSIADMIVVGNYDGYVNPSITDQNFPVVGSGIVETEAVLVHLNRLATDAEVLAEIDRLGLRAGLMPELLALGAQYPDLQRQFLIVALGSVWARPLGRRRVGYLWGRPSRRFLGLAWLGLFRWHPGYRFLAFRK
ncbi:hypothetical protein KY386_00475 [Candidatus Parcubacteria bacterium]|nr:hypothetical protein [Candidatus Parcubacteria bacterium]